MSERYPRETTKRKLRDWNFQKMYDKDRRDHRTYEIKEQVKTGIFYGFLVSAALGIAVLAFSLFEGLYYTVKSPSPRDGFVIGGSK